MQLSENSNEIEPNYTFKIDWENNRIRGTIEEPIEAVKQAAQLCLSIPRLDHLIYSINYGHEFNYLIGKEKEYVDGSIRRMIEECLLIDNRIEKIDNFDLSKNNEILRINFTVYTIYGDFKMQKGMNLWNLKK